MTKQVATAQRACVLLRNRNVLFGRVVPTGDEVVIQRASGGNLTLPRGQVLHWADDLPSLFEYLQRQNSATSVSEHMTDARWCIRYGLLKQAYREIQHAESMGADLSQVQSIKRQLYRAIQEKRGRVSGEAVAIAKASYANLGEANLATSAPPAPELEKQDYATLRHFVGVQSTLINRCGNCHRKHVPTTEVKWRLHIPSGGSRLSTRLTRENLAETLRYVSFETPMESQIRLRAIDGHAGEDYRLSQRDARALEGLENWVAVAKPTGPALSLAKQVYAEADPVEPADTLAPNSEGAEELNGPEQDRVSRLPDVGNPFDPEIFNRRVHGK